LEHPVAASASASARKKQQRDLELEEPYIEHWFSRAEHCVVELKGWKETPTWLREHIQGLLKLAPAGAVLSDFLNIAAQTQTGSLAELCDVLYQAQLELRNRPVRNGLTNDGRIIPMIQYRRACAGLRTQEAIDFPEKYWVVVEYIGVKDQPPLPGIQLGERINVCGWLSEGNNAWPGRCTDNRTYYMQGMQRKEKRTEGEDATRTQIDSEEVQLSANKMRANLQ
jgi:hypothetical protein